MSDDTTKSQDPLDPNLPISHTPLPQHIHDDSPTTPSSQTPSTSYSKEGEPVSAHRVEVQPEVKSDNLESEKFQEEKEVGEFVEEIQDEPEIHPDLKKAGLQAIETSTLDWKYRVHLPISDEKVMDGLEQPPSSGFRWIAEIAIFMLKRGHLALKRIHGKVVRIIRK